MIPPLLPSDSVFYGSHEISSLFYDFGLLPTRLLGSLPLPPSLHSPSQESSERLQAHSLAGRGYVLEPGCGV